MDVNKIRDEYDNAVAKKKELAAQLREIEKTEPSSFGKIWRSRDQVAYWEGKSEGLKIALDELDT